jgi:hypothetical protein
MRLFGRSRPPPRALPADQINSPHTPVESARATLRPIERRGDLWRRRHSQQPSKPREASRKYLLASEP